MEIMQATSPAQELGRRVVQLEQRLRHSQYALLAALALSLGAVPAQAQSVAMDEWYLPTPDRCRLYVLEMGTGPDTVVVLPGGFGQDHTYMMPAFDGTYDRLHVVFFDPRGALRSACPDSLVSLQKHVDDLDRLRQTLGIRRMNVAGHSAGTMHAMTYLQQHPDNVRALVLLGALSARSFPEDGHSLESHMVAARELMTNRLEMFAELKKAGLDKDTSLFTPKDRAHYSKIHLAAMSMYHVERWQLLHTFYSVSAGAAADRSVPVPYDFTGAIGAHRCRVWVLMGDHDYVDYGLPRTHRWIKDVPNARLAVIKNAGHVLWLDDPEEFRTDLLNALGKGAECSAE
jgi:pimeloyl-ACP methyl ester carboxylesterase